MTDEANKPKIRRYPAKRKTDDFPEKFAKLKAQKILTKIIEHANAEIIGHYMDEEVPEQMKARVAELVLNSLEMANKGLLQ